MVVKGVAEGEVVFTPVPASVFLSGMRILGPLLTRLADSVRGIHVPAQVELIDWEKHLAVPFLQPVLGASSLKLHGCLNAPDILASVLHNLVRKIIIKSSKCLPF